MIIEVQLYHESTGWFVISEPDGWKDAKLGFERHEEAFHCLVEFFRSAFRAYGSNGVENGGRENIKIIERDYGLSALLKTLIRIKDTEFDEFEDFYHGQIPIVSLIEVIDEDHTIGFTNEQNDTWSKLISRLDMPVNIQSPTSIDGVDVDVLTPLYLGLTPQIIEMRLESKQKNAFNTGATYPDDFSSPDFQNDIASGGYAQINLDDIVLDELRTNYNIPFSAVTNLISVADFLSPDYAGDINIDIKLCLAIFRTNFVPGFNNDLDQIYMDLAGVDFTYEAEMWIAVGTNPPLLFNRLRRSTSFSVPGGTQTNEWSEFTLIETIPDVAAGTPIKIYLQNVGSSPWGYRYNTIEVLVQQLVVLGDASNEIPMQPIVDDYFPGTYIQGPTLQLRKDFGLVTGGVSVESYIKIYQNTILPTTEAQGFLVHDLARSILDRICDQNNTLVSEFLGNPSTPAGADGATGYAEAGCGSNNGVFRGLQIRGYSLADKSFSMSFKDFWEGLDPVYNLALWSTRDPDTGKISIYIGQKKDVYIATEASVVISNVRKISKSYDEQNIHNSYRNGYSQWESSDISGLDDPQTVHDRANNLRGIVGNKWEKLSSWIAASYAIATTQRTRKEQSADYQYDNDTFLIALTPTFTGFKPELDENFTSVTGVKFPDTRYNLRHTPARMFLRWRDFLSGALQTNPGNGFTFQGGEGNYDMISTIPDGDCDANAVEEKQDLPVSSDFLFIPRLFTFDTVLSLEEYKSIRENPNVGIAVSQTNSNHVIMLIKDLEFTPYTGEATIKAWARVWVDLQVPTDDVTIPENMGRIFDDSFDLTFE